MHGEASVYLREGRLPIVKKTANTQDLFPFCESTAGHIPSSISKGDRSGSWSFLKKITLQDTSCIRTGTLKILFEAKALDRNIFVNSTFQSFVIHTQKNDTTESIN